MAPERPFPILIETGKSYSKTGLLPAVSQRFSDSFASGLPAVFRRFSSGFPAVFRRFSGGFPTVSGRFSDSFLGFPSSTAVSRRFGGQRFDSGSTAGFPAFSSGFASGLPAVLPAVFNSFPAVFPAFRQGFSGSFPAVSRQHASPGSNPTGSGVPLHPKETAGNSVHTFTPTNPA